MGKESACNAGDAGDEGLTLASGRSPGGGHGNPLQYSWLENSPGQSSLVGYSPQYCKESDTTEATKHTHTHIHLIVKRSVVGLAHIYSIYKDKGVP